LLRRHCEEKSVLPTFIVIHAAKAQETPVDARGAVVTWPEVSRHKKKMEGDGKRCKRFGVAKSASHWCCAAMRPVQFWKGAIQSEGHVVAFHGQ
jgi:hypothetical protein